MHIIIFLWLVTIVQGTRQSCENTNCKKLPELVVVPKCKCFEKYLEWLRVHKPHKRPHKNTNTIFHVPAENVILEQLLGYPINFRNKLAITPYHNNKVPTDIIPNYIISRKYKPHSPPAKNKRKYIENTVPIENLADDGNFPMYLDINEHDSRNNEESFIGDLYQNKVKDLTEKHIRDCFDLYVILSSRDQRIGSQVNSSLLDERNKMYIKLSTSDLRKEIIKKCIEPANILTESLIEIRRSMPYSKKSYSMKGSNKYTLDESKTTTIKNIILEVDIQESHSNNFKGSETNFNVNTILSNELDLAKKSELLDDGSRTHDADTLSTKPMELTKRSYDNVSTTTTPGYDSQDSTTPFQDITFTNIQDVTLSLEGDVTSIKPEIGFKLYSYNFTQINFTRSTTDVFDDRVPMVDDSIIHSASKISDHIQNENSVSEQNSHEFINVEGTRNNTNLDINVSENIPNEKNRTEYFEGDYAIPKIVTIEFSNNTAMSEVQSNEELPNFDFTTLSSDIFLPTQQYGDISLTDQWNRNNATNYINKYDIDITDSKNKEKNSQNDTGYTGFDFSGKFYFKYGPEYVPASFVQKTDGGEVNVVFDLLSLCKINRNETDENSKLLLVLCNCIIKK